MLCTRGSSSKASRGKKNAGEKKLKTMEKRGDLEGVKWRDFVFGFGFIHIRGGRKKKKNKKKTPNKWLSFNDLACAGGITTKDSTKGKTERSQPSGCLSGPSRFLGAKKFGLGGGE